MLLMQGLLKKALNVPCQRLQLPNLFFHTVSRTSETSRSFRQCCHYLHHNSLALQLQTRPHRNNLICKKALIFFPSRLKQPKQASRSLHLSNNDQSNKRIAQPFNVLLLLTGYLFLSVQEFQTESLYKSGT